MKGPLISNLLGLIGASVGGVLGFYTFGWLYHYGFYGMVIPGAFVGLGCGLLARHRSLARGIVCGAGALVLSIFTEWRYFPFQADDSLGYMVAHMKDLSPVSLLMMGLGTFVAYWVGQDAGFQIVPRRGSPRPSEAKAQDTVEDA